MPIFPKKSKLLNVFRKIRYFFDEKLIFVPAVPKLVSAVLIGTLDALRPCRLGKSSRYRTFFSKPSSKEFKQMKPEVNILLPSANFCTLNRTKLKNKHCSLLTSKDFFSKILNYKSKAVR